MDGPNKGAQDECDESQHDASAASGGTERTTRIAVYVLGGSLVALLLTGVPLIWQYDPLRAQLVRDLHNLASFVFVIAAVVLLIAAGFARIRQLPAHLGWVAALAIVLLSQVGGVSGLLLGWDVVGEPSYGDVLMRAGVLTEEEADLLAEDEAGDSETGIIGALTDDVDTIYADSSVLTQAGYQQIALAHLVLIPLAAVAVYGFGRRRRRLAAPPESDSPEVVARKEK
jgi:hypothetical protein